MRKYEFQGKTVEKAIEEGLKELAVSQFDVDIKILESGGLFKKARVEITINDDEEVSFKDAVKEEVKKAVEKNEPKPVEPKEDNPEEKVEEEKANEPAEVNEPVEEISEPVDAQEETNEPAEAVEEIEEVEEVEEQEETPAKRERVYADNKGTKQFLEGLFEKLGIEAEVEIVEEDEHTKAFVSTEKAGLVIGHRGEMLSAIQYLANIVEQKSNRYAKRVVVDVANYRENRDDSLND